MEKIDELDRKILKIITQSARIPFKDVAEQCGVSRAAVHQRVQKMFDNGVITGSSYHVHPKSLGYQLCVYIGITMEKASMYNQVISACIGEDPRGGRGAIYARRFRLADQGLRSR